MQLSLRLLVPPGSALLSAPDIGPFLGPLDAEALSYRWTHPDPRMDRLEAEVAALVEAAAQDGEPPAATLPTDPSPGRDGRGVPRRGARAEPHRPQAAARAAAPDRVVVLLRAADPPPARRRVTESGRRMPPIGRGFVACLAAVAGCGTKGASEMHDATVVDVAPPVDPLCASAEDAGVTTSPPFAFVQAILRPELCFLPFGGGGFSFSPTASPGAISSAAPRRPSSRVVERSSCPASPTRAMSIKSSRTTIRAPARACPGASSVPNPSPTASRLWCARG